jgi:3'-5' exoribonuclease
MLREAAAAIPDLDPTRLLMLEHIIIGHQGKREWASPVEPKTIECLLVHYADDLDAKAAMFVKAVTAEGGAGLFTGRKNPFNRELYRGT